MTLQISTQISEISPSGVKNSLPLYERELDFSEGVLKETFVIDNSVVDTQVTPIVINISNYPNITGVFLRGSYVDDALTENIASGDPAKFQVEFNESGLWLEATSVNLQDFTPTHIKVKAQGTKKVRVERTISARS